MHPHKQCISSIYEAEAAAFTLSLLGDFSQLQLT
jgi:hypothetical protein